MSESKLPPSINVLNEHLNPEAMNWLGGECNRLKYGTCSTLRCMRRGGYHSLPMSTSVSAYELSTCEPYEIYLALHKMGKMLANDIDALTKIRDLVRSL